MSEPGSPSAIYLALQRRARAERRATQELFELYLLERFLYRLAVSEYRDRFVLKGGLLLTVLGSRRTTRDADVLALNLSNDADVAAAVVGRIVGIAWPDGVSFAGSDVRTRVIRESATYTGLRLTVPAMLGTANLQLNLDISFGDPVAPETIVYPTLLDGFAPFALLAYPVEAVLAEKIETMIVRGDANTRERDFADVLTISRMHAVDASRLEDALRRTAGHRGTMLAPLAQAVRTLPDARQPNWRAFRERTGLSGLPESFREVVTHVSAFCDPLLRGDSGLTRWDPLTRQWEREGLLP